MQLCRCPHCDVVVVLADNGQCPSCRQRTTIPGSQESSTPTTDSCKDSIPLARLAESFCRSCGKQVVASDANCSCGVRPMDGRNYCPYCKFLTYASEDQCFGCGAAIQAGRPGSPRTLVAATPPFAPSQMALLNLIALPGLAQFVVGQTTKGIFLMLCYPFAGPLVRALSAADAYYVAKRLRAGHAIRPWRWF
jgi:hypothetical protein